MKAELAKPFFFQLARQAIAAVQGRYRGMESRVEAGELRQPGPQMRQQPRRLQPMRLVQWRQRRQPFQHGNGFRFQPYRGGEAIPAMNNAMAYRYEAIPLELAFDPVDQGGQHGVGAMHTPVHLWQHDAMAAGV
jgi:hypothetical protein